MEIYAGRYHYQTMKMPDLFADIKNGTKKVAELDFYQKDKAYDITLSDEGLASAAALREYSEKNPFAGQTNLKENIDEFNKQLLTANIDTSSLCKEEMASVCDDLKKEYGLPNKSASFEDQLTLMAKAYQVVHDRIEAEFADPNREITYVWDENKERVVETKEDRMAGLNKAYESYAEFASASYQSQVQFMQAVSGEKFDFADQIADKVKQAYMDSISEKNMERLSKKVNSFHDYNLAFTVSSDWMDLINILRD